MGRSWGREGGERKGNRAGAVTTAVAGVEPEGDRNREGGRGVTGEGRYGAEGERGSGSGEGGKERTACRRGGKRVGYRYGMRLASSSPAPQRCRVCASFSFSLVVCTQLDPRRRPRAALGLSSAITPTLTPTPTPATRARAVRPSHDRFKFQIVVLGSVIYGRTDVRTAPCLHPPLPPHLPQRASVRARPTRSEGGGTRTICTSASTSTSADSSHFPPHSPSILHPSILLSTPPLRRKTASKSLAKGKHPVACVITIFTYAIAVFPTASERVHPTHCHRGGTRTRTCCVLCAKRTAWVWMCVRTGVGWVWEGVVEEREVVGGEGIVDVDLWEEIPVETRGSAIQIRELRSRTFGGRAGGLSARARMHATCI
jgi:hypothetical protein